MSCGRCGSPNLFQFESSKGAVAPAMLPLVCRGCGQITVNGEPLVFPAELEKQAQDMAAAAAAVGKETADQVLVDPDQRIEVYFTNVYRRAYLDGFFRALLFWRHHGKEGRLRRVRDLWRQLAPLAHVAESSTIALNIPKAAYDELRQLLELGEHHAPRPANERSSLPVRHARVSRRAR
jgi:hypothetical protein